MRVMLRLLVPVMLVVVAAGCGSTAAPPSGGSSGSDTFTYDDSTQIMVGWDPATGYSEEHLAFANMYEGLTRYNNLTRKVEPLLATSWSKNPAGTEWTFHLRHGVVFHTGRPFNAAAVKASIERTVHLGQGASYEWGPVKTISTPDDYTVMFKLSQPAPLDLISSAGYGAWIYDTKAAGSADLGKWFAEGHDAGTGPYTVQQWSKGQDIELRLKSFPKYWGGWKGTHYDRVVFRVSPEASTSAQLLRGGQVSFVRQLSPQLISSMQGESGVRVVQGPSFVNMFAMLNTERAPLDNPAVRRALAWGVNYAGIQAVNKGAMLPGGGIIPAGLIGYSNKLPEYHYDPAKAKALLQSAGYGPGGKSINLTLTYIVDDALEMPVAQLMKSSLAALNVNVHLEALQWPVLWAKTKGNKDARQDIAMYEWYPDYPDPYSWFINLFVTQNPVNFNATYYSNPVVDSLAASASKATATNPGKAQLLYEELQTKLLHDAPAIPIGTVENQYGMLDNFSGFHPNPAYQDVVFAYTLKPTGGG